VGKENRKNARNEQQKGNKCVKKLNKEMDVSKENIGKLEIRTAKEARNLIKKEKERQKDWMED
jgi:hypothetical protein